MGGGNVARDGSYLSFSFIEIENARGEDSHEPRQEMERGEEFICHLGNYNSIRNTYSVAIGKEKLRDEAVLKARYLAKVDEDERESLQKEIMKCHAEHEFFMDLFWMEVKKRLEENHPDVWVRGIGMRKGWKVVYTDAGKSINLLDLVRRILGG